MGHTKEKLKNIFFSFKELRDVCANDVCANDVCANDVCFNDVCANDVCEALNKTGIIQSSLKMLLSLKEHCCNLSANLPYEGTRICTLGTLKRSQGM